jgi:recombination protein RecT
MSDRPSDRTQSTYQRGQQDEKRKRDREELQTGVVTVMDKQKDKFLDILPKTVEWEDFRSCFLTAVQRNYRLLEADRDSLWLALQDCALSGLRPDGKEAALVIFGDDSEDEDGNVVTSTANKKKKVQLLPMVWGLCRLVHNTGLVSDVRARCVYDGEVFRHWEEDGKEHYEYRRVIDPDFDDDPKHIVGAFAVIQFKDGSYKMDFMSRRQIERRRAVSRAKKGPWGPWYDEQAMKTVLKHVMKGAQKSRELQHVSNLLEKDTSLPTIEGDRAEEVHDNHAATDPVRSAFRGEERKTGTQQTTRRQATSTTQTEPTQDTVKTNVAPKSDQKPPADDHDAWRTQTAKGDETRTEVKKPTQETKPTPQAEDKVEPPFDPKTGEIQSQETPINGSGDQPFNVWLVNENGEEVDTMSYTDPVQFAASLATECAGKDAETIDAIFDYNDYGIAMCRDLSEQAAKIISAIQKAAPASDDRGQTDEGGAVETTSGTIKPPAQLIAIPKTPADKPHWPNYLAAARKVFDQCQSIEELVGQAVANKLTYFGKSSIQTENDMGRIYESAMAKFTDSADASQRPDLERVQADWFLKEMEDATSLETLMAISARPDLRITLGGWQKARPELLKEVLAFAGARKKQLSPGG